MQTLRWGFICKGFIKECFLKTSREKKLQCGVKQDPASAWSNQVLWRMHYDFVPQCKTAGLSQFWAHQSLAMGPPGRGVWIPRHLHLCRSARAGPWSRFKWSLLEVMHNEAGGGEHTEAKEWSDLRDLGWNRKIRNDNKIRNENF